MSEKNWDNPNPPHPKQILADLAAKEQVAEATCQHEYRPNWSQYRDDDTVALICIKCQDEQPRLPKFVTVQGRKWCLDDIAYCGPRTNEDGSQCWVADLSHNDREIALTESEYRELQPLLTAYEQQRRRIIFPESPAAISVPFATLPTDKFIRGSPAKKDENNA